MELPYEMQRRGEVSVRSKMEELRLICEREITIQQQRMETASLSFRKALDSIKANAQETVENQEKLGKLKALLREVEDDWVKALAVKTRKEARRMAVADSIAAAKSRIEELKKIVIDQSARKDEYAAIISHQSEAMAEFEEKLDKNTGCGGEIEEAISWYNRVLGFRIECGRGVTYIFTKINPKNPKEEYSFTIRHESDIYTLLDCNPQVNDTKELIQELNRTNDLYKLVRTMRGKFQEVAACGNFLQITSIDQGSSTVSVSAPVSSVSTDSRSESPAKQAEIQPVETNKFPSKGNFLQITSLDQGSSTVSVSAPVSSVSTDGRSESPAKQAEIQPVETNKFPSKGNRDRGGKQAILSAGSASSLRRSLRFKVKK